MDSHVRPEGALPARRLHLTSRRTALAIAGGVAVLAACEAPGTPASPASSGQTGAKPAGTSGTEIRIQTVTQPDMGGWIEEALKQDIDGRKAKQPNVTVKVETFGAWRSEEHTSELQSH